MKSWLSLFRSPPPPLLPDTSTPSALPSTTCPEKHDVFLSFRGEDTRNNFTSQLYEALCSKQIETFIDDEELDRGGEISPSLLKAIEQSNLSVIIFSKNYASSKWCLDELVKILESKEKNGQIVIPVFYHVDPSNVRKQCGSYALFPKHWQLIFLGNMNKLPKWKAALTEAANLSGWDSTNIMSEAQLVKRVVQDILLKLNRMSQGGFNSKDLVGIDKHIVKIESLLQIGPLNVRIVGIWGMGGIGKTTIADAVFTKLVSLFESYCFVANVREQVERFGLNYLRDKCLSDLLEQENLRIGTPSMGSTFVKERLRRKKALVVFDDVDDPNHLEYLLGNSGDRCFGSGSRVMVTCRDRQILVKAANEIYEVPKMNFHESLLLFCLNAFKQDNCVEDFKELSERMVYYCDGIPLALKVLGASLYGKSKEKWESSLKKLEETPHKDIQKVLKLSYDGLDEKEKAIFLDIACFFFEFTRLADLTAILGHSAIMTIDILVDLSLVSISYDGKNIYMHDLIRKMGQEIIRQQSTIEPRRRSRLWSAKDICSTKDICHMLTNNTGTNEVECISLDMSEINELHISATALQLPNLRLFSIHDNTFSSKVHVLGGPVRFSDGIRFLKWIGYPCKSLEIHSTENLVELRLPFSHLEKLWDGFQNVPNLRKVDLIYSDHLVRFPDLSQATNLLSVNLLGCRKLKMFPVVSTNIKELVLGETAIEEVPSSIARLAQLSTLDLSSCESLQNLSSNICKLKSLCELNLSGCLRLVKFPEITEPMENLRVLRLSRTSIKELPSWLVHLIGLKTLDLLNCKNLEFIPNNICNLIHLQSFSLSHSPKIDKFSTIAASLCSLKQLQMNYCSSLSEIPNEFGCLSSLESLSLRGSNIVTISSSIKLLINLVALCVSHSTRLQSLPDLPPSLLWLDASDCPSLTTVSNPRETISNRESHPCYYGQFEMDLRNCLKLDPYAYDNILGEIANAIKYCSVDKPTCDMIVVKVPGSEIPKWFPYQSNGPSLTIKWIPPTSVMVTTMSHLQYYLVIHMEIIPALK
ncbi:putative disease resistance protein (TIR-NBS-LRR class) [Quillaja saponaria]|uniref:ADP-ribosyl cyclase/cyclic ADP-ribose hydrolase n=1 Tax=Quillaja saponaria TaxID=32244 RepID=A0AAD7PNC8_QUISA|nr:putative disease resistance protein (TIR-NBS-LRR class) [Quillaja saponaria]